MFHQAIRRGHVCRMIGVLALITAAVPQFGWAQPTSPGKEDRKDLTQKPNVQSFVGTFEGGGMSISATEANGEYSGFLRNGGKSFPFKGKVEKGQLIGSFRNEGSELPFKLTPKGPNLIFVSGFNNITLKPTFDTSAFLGVFRLSNVVVSIEESPSGLKGIVKNTKGSWSFKARLEGEKFLGEFEGAGSPRTIAGTVQNGVLAVSIGPDQYRLPQVRFGDAQTAQFSVEESVLATFKDVIEATIQVSPDNNRVSYIDQTTGRRRAMINGQLSKTSFDVVAMSFSPDSKRHAYLMKKENSWRVQVDGIESDVFTAARPSSRFFSPDSERYAFAARSDGQWRLYLDGKPGESYDDLGGIVFSPDSKRIAHIARKGDRLFVIVDGIRAAEVGAFGFPYLIFSPDSKRLAYVIQRPNEQAVVIGGKASKWYQSIAFVTFSSQGGRFGFIGETKKGFVVAVDGKEGRPFDRIYSLRFSPHGKQYAFVGVRNGVRKLVVDGKEVEEKEGFGPMVWSRDGSASAIAVAHQKASYVAFNGVPGKKYQMVTDLQFGPLGKTFSYFGKDASSGWQVVVDGRPGNSIDEKPKSFAFSPSGRHFAYFGVRNGKNHLIVDGVFSPLRGKLVPGTRIVFEDDNKFHTVVRREAKFVRLEGLIQ